MISLGLMLLQLNRAEAAEPATLPPSAAENNLSATSGCEGKTACTEPVATCPVPSPPPLG